MWGSVVAALGQGQEQARALVRVLARGQDRLHHLARAPVRDPPGPGQKLARVQGPTQVLEPGQDQDLPELDRKLALMLDRMQDLGLVRDQGHHLELDRKPALLQAPGLGRVQEEIEVVVDVSS